MTLFTISTTCNIRTFSKILLNSFKGDIKRYSTFVNKRNVNRIILQSSNTFKSNYCRVFRWFKTNSNETKPRIRIGLSPVQVVTNEPGSFRKLLKPLLFTMGFCGASFVGATVLQYENMRSDAVRQVSGLKTALWKKTPTTYKEGELRRRLNSWWNSLSEGERLAVGIISVNVAVFAMWRVKALQPFMLRYFSSNPSSKTVCLPMLLSTFSHYSIFHLAANMYVLFSFSNIAGKMFGQEQLLGVYLSAGVVSSFASYIHKISTKALTPSLGASGALMAILAPICVQYPDAKIALIFLPFFTFSAGSAITVVMGLDAVGLLLRWKIFDHAAHLGGAIFGICYLYAGQDYVWKNREPVMMWWHKLRESVSGKP